MESAMANVSSTVTSVLIIVVLAFVVGHVYVGTYVRKHGGSAKLTQLASSLAILTVLVGGVMLYVRD
ncbi:MAG: cytochrome bd-type quinol oxidase subunit 2 [Zhongshania sp.]|jgi:cytochrome bd-type quinol oxidase subunit 2